MNAYLRSIFPCSPSRFFSLCLVLAAVLFASGNPLQAQILAADPMVRITSLPLPGINVQELLVKVSNDVASATGIDKNMITYYYQTFDAMYCPISKNQNDRVLFVDLNVPVFMSDKDIGNVMTAIAEALAKHTGIPKEWVFIHTYFPKPGHVFIAGQIADDKPPKAPESKK